MLLGYFVSVSLLNYVAGTPGYGSYEYNGHGHRGYNEIGTVNKVVDYYVSSIFLNLVLSKFPLSFTFQ